MEAIIIDNIIDPKYNGGYSSIHDDGQAVESLPMTKAIPSKSVMSKLVNSLIKSNPRDIDKISLAFMADSVIVFV
jgi:hypothetical protein